MPTLVFDPLHLVLIAFLLLLYFTYGRGRVRREMRFANVRSEFLKPIIQRWMADHQFRMAQSDDDSIVWQKELLLSKLVFRLRIFDQGRGCALAGEFWLKLIIFPDATLVSRYSLCETMGYVQRKRGWNLMSQFLDHLADLGSGEIVSPPPPDPAASE